MFVASPSPAIKTPPPPPNQGGGKHPKRVVRWSISHLAIQNLLIRSQQRALICSPSVISRTRHTMQQRLQGAGKPVVLRSAARRQRRRRRRSHRKSPNPWHWAASGLSFTVAPSGCLSCAWSRGQRAGVPCTVDGAHRPLHRASHHFPDPAMALGCAAAALRARNARVPGRAQNTLRPAAKGFQTLELKL